MNVRFFRLDRPKVEQALRRYAESLAENPRVLAVVLFGSLARGDATAMSDADMMIILSDASEPFHLRISAFLRPGVGIAMDVFPYTLNEALQALREGWGVVSVAVREGRWLVDKAAVCERLQRAVPPVVGQNTETNCFRENEPKIR